MNKWAAAIAALVLMLAGPAAAQPYTYQYQTPGGIIHILAGQVTGNVLPYNQLVDSAANPFGVTGNPLSINFGSGVTLPSFASAQHFICDSGCSTVSNTFGNPIGTTGTAIGFKDGFGNFQPVLGDATNGLWISIKGTIALPVTGTFFQTTQPISATSLPLPTGAATQTTLASILSTLGSPFQAGASIGNTSFGISGTLPAFAATPTVNLGTLNGAATATLQGTGNTSLASIDGKTPALGQALSAASVPVVLTAAQIAALTPPTSVIANPTNASGSMSAKTVTNSSTQMVAAAVAHTILLIKNESLTATIACSLGGTAALNTAGSFTIPAGWKQSWEGNYVPADQVNCISSASSSPATVEAQ